MVDVVIPLGRGSKHQNIELMYCLRSIERFLKGYRDIYIVTDKLPKWVTGVKHIYCEDEQGGTKRERNIYRKILAACQDTRVSENFLFMNDDHFLTDFWDAATFPYFYHYTLRSLSKTKREWDKYLYTINNTIKEIGEDKKNFDIHCPIVYNKEKFTLLLGKSDWSTRFGFLIKSLYCYRAEIAGVPNKDIRIQSKMNYIDIALEIRNNGWFSINDRAFEGDIKFFLKNVYGEKSSYEAGLVAGTCEKYGQMGSIQRDNDAPIVGDGSYSE